MSFISISYRSVWRFSVVQCGSTCRSLVSGLQPLQEVRPDNGEVRSGREADGDLTTGFEWSPLRESQQSGNHLLGLVGKSLLCAGEVGVPRVRVP
jgi:hypothetical protein